MRRFLPMLVLVLSGCSSSKPEPELTVVAPRPPRLSEELVPQKPTNVQTVTFMGNLGETPMDLIRPVARKSVHRAVVLIHGGGWMGGTRKDMLKIGQALAAKGFLGVSIEYTLARQGRWPSQLVDGRAAVRYIRQHARELDVDPDWIGAAGVSAGGHLAFWLGVADEAQQGVSGKVQAVGSISGIHDLNAPLTMEGSRYRIVEALLGEEGNVQVEARQKASPVTYVTSTSAPAMFIQGDADELVPKSQSELAVARLKAAGVPTELRMVKGMDHGLVASRREDAEALDELAAWFRRHLKVASK